MAALQREGYCDDYYSKLKAGQHDSLKILVFDNKRKVILSAYKTKQTTPTSGFEPELMFSITEFLSFEFLTMKTSKMRYKIDIFHVFEKVCLENH